MKKLLSVFFAAALAAMISAPAALAADAVVDHECSAYAATIIALDRADMEPLGPALGDISKNGISFQQWKGKKDKKILTANEEAFHISLFLTRKQVTCHSFRRLDEVIGQLMIFMKDGKKADDYFACGADCTWDKDPMATYYYNEDQ